MDADGQSAFFRRLVYGVIFPLAVGGVRARREENLRHVGALADALYLVHGVLGVLMRHGDGPAQASVFFEPVLDGPVVMRACQGRAELRNSHEGDVVIRAVQHPVAHPVGVQNLLLKHGEARTRRAARRYGVFANAAARRFGIRRVRQFRIVRFFDVVSPHDRQIGLESVQGRGYVVDVGVHHAEARLGDRLGRFYGLRRRAHYRSSMRFVCILARENEKRRFPRRTEDVSIRPARCSARTG